MSPRKAMFLKHILHMPNFLRNARDLPQRGHRLYFLTANFWGRLALAINDFFATSFLPSNLISRICYFKA